MIKLRKGYKSMSMLIVEDEKDLCKEISLTTKEYKLLQYMMRNPGHVLSRDQLEQRGWDSTFEGGSNIIDVYIRYLRKKIDSDYEKKLIHTVYGKGYCLGE